MNRHEPQARLNLLDLPLAFDELSPAHPSRCGGFVTGAAKAAGLNWTGSPGHRRSGAIKLGLGPTGRWVYRGVGFLGEFRFAYSKRSRSSGESQG